MAIKQYYIPADKAHEIVIVDNSSANTPVTTSIQGEYRAIAGILADGVFGTEGSTITFGARTLVGNAARPTTIPNGTYGQFTVSGGLLSLNTSPATPGIIEIEDVTINVLENTCDIGEGEFYESLEYWVETQDDASGMTFRLLPGSDTWGESNPYRWYEFPETCVLSEPVTIKSMNPADKGRIGRLSFMQDGEVQLQDLIIHDQMRLWDRPQFGILYMDGAANNETTVVIDRCDISSQFVPYEDLHSHDSPKIPLTEVEEGKYYLIYQSEVDDWSPIGGPDISEVGDFYQTWSFNADITGDISSYGAVLEWPKSLALVSAYQNTSEHTRNLTIRDSKLYNTTCHIWGWFNNLTIERCELDNCYWSMIDISPVNDDSTITIKDCIFERSFGELFAGIKSYKFPNHYIQIEGGNISTVNNTKYEIVGNRFWPNGSEETPDGIIIYTDTSSFIDLRFMHNILFSGVDYTGGIFGNLHDQSEIKYNTFAFAQYPSHDLYPPQNPPGIYTYDSEGVGTIRNNIGAFDTDSLPQLLRSNYAIAYWSAPNSWTDPSFNKDAANTVLEGPFGYDELFTDQDLLDAMKPKIGSPVDKPSGPKIGAQWYYSWATTPVGSVSGAGAGTATNPTFSAPDAFTSEQWQLRGGNTLITLEIVELPEDNGSLITDIEYRVNGGSWVSTGLSWTGSVNITGLTNNTEYTIDVRAVNSYGSGVIATKTGYPYLVVAVAVDSAGYAALTGASISGSKRALFGFSFNMGNITHHAGNIFTMRDSSDNNRVLVRSLGNSSGAISVTLADILNTPIGFYQLPDGYLTNNVWYTICFSFDSERGAGGKALQGYIRASGGSWIDIRDIAGSTHTSVENGLIGDMTRISVAPLSGLELRLADVYAATDRTMDLSILSNRNKFLPTNFKGTDGALITGTAPSLFMSGAAASWHTNKGTAGGLTKTGTISNYATLPT